MKTTMVILMVLGFVATTARASVRNDLLSFDEIVFTDGSRAFIEDIEAVSPLRRRD